MSEVRDRVSDGAVSFKEISDAMKVATSEGGQFYKGMEVASQTLNGQISTLTDNAMALAGEIVKPLTDSLSQTLVPGAISAIDTLLAAMEKDGVQGLAQAGIDMIEGFANGFLDNIPSLISAGLTALENLGAFLTENVPIFIDKGFEMLNKFVDGIISALPEMIARLPAIITTFANIINDNFPIILMKGVELLWKLITGILSAIPDLIANIPQIVEAIYSVIMAFNWLNLGKSIIDFFTKGIKAMVKFVGSAGKDVASSIWNALTHLPQTLFNLGKTMIKNMSNAIENTTGTVGGAIKGLIRAILDWFMNLPVEMAKFGRDLVKGLWNGIGDMTGWIIGKIKGFGSSVLGGIKDFFGIKSPSRVMRDQVGKYLPEGIEVGFKAQLPKSMKSINDDLKMEIEGMRDIAVDNVSNKPMQETIRNVGGNDNSTNVTYNINQEFNNNDTTKPSEVAQEVVDAARRLEWERK